MKQLMKGLESIFVPNEFALDFIAEMVESSAEYCSSKFANNPSYYRNIFHNSLDEVFPICLTGPAGVGKSALISALQRVLPNPILYSIPDSLESVELLSHWLISARNKPTTKQVLIELLSKGDENDQVLRRNTHGLLSDAQRYVGKIGLPLVILEELQHMSFSSTATATIVSLLLMLSKLGVPMVYVSNYSLLHKLFRRNIEEKQRLLANPRVMMPDKPESGDWHGYLDECIRVVGIYISASQNFLYGFLYVNTYGLKRLVVKLIGLAYYEARRQGRHQMEEDDFFSAIVSPEYIDDRKEVLALVNQDYNSIYRRPDNWCPFEFPQTTSAKLSEHYKELDQQRVSAAMLKSALSAKEKEILDKLESKEASAEKPSTPRRRTKVSLEEMQAGHRRLMAEQK